MRAVKLMLMLYNALKGVILERVINDDSIRFSLSLSSYCSQTNLQFLIIRIYTV